MSEGYAGKQIVGIDLHRRRSVIVRIAESGDRLETVRIVNDRDRLAEVMARAGGSPGGGAGSDVWLVLGGGRAGRARGWGALGASAGGESVFLPAGQER